MWIVLYDANCGFCKWLLASLLRWDRKKRLRPVALQEPAAGPLLEGLAFKQRMESWHLISPGGERRSGGSALPPLLRLLPGGQLPAAALARLPRFTDRAYRWVADHRSQLSRWVPEGAKQRAAERVSQRSRPSQQRPASSS